MTLILGTLSVLQHLLSRLFSLGGSATIGIVEEELVLVEVVAAAYIIKSKNDIVMRPTPHT